MKSLCKYRKSDYFNDEDFYLLYNDVFKRYHVTKLQNYNGNWCSLLGLEYKMSSVPCVNYNELHGLRVRYLSREYTKGEGYFYEETPIEGNLSTHHAINDNLGVRWDRGENVRKYGLTPFWQEPKHLKLL